MTKDKENRRRILRNPPAAQKTFWKEWVEKRTNGQEYNVTWPSFFSFEESTFTSFFNDKETGVKFDEEKERWSLLPIDIVEDIVKVLDFGAKKYGVDNWKKMEDKERYYSAMMRHIVAWRKGEDLDSETGFHHLTHAMTNIVFLMYFFKKENNSTL
jgi:hypothetical protein